MPTTEERRVTRLERAVRRLVQAAPGSGVVTSVFSRTGSVVANSNDYTWAQINKATSSLGDLTTRLHSDLTDKGTNDHATIDTYIATGAALLFAPIGKGVTNGDLHNHTGGDGGQIAHGDLSAIGSNSHSAIDTYIATTAPGTFAPIAKGVTNGDSHNHTGGDGGQIAHGDLSGIGSTAHTAIDSHIGDTTTNPHAVTLTLAESAGGSVSSAGTPTAIHSDTANEIAIIGAKATPTTADFLLIEDAADTNAKKRITIGDLASAGLGVSDNDYGDVVVSSGGTVWTVDAGIDKTWTGAHEFTAEVKVKGLVLDWGYMEAGDVAVPFKARWSTYGIPVDESLGSPIPTAHFMFVADKMSATPTGSDANFHTFYLNDGSLTGSGSTPGSNVVAYVGLDGEYYPVGMGGGYIGEWSGQWTLTGAYTYTSAARIFDSATRFVPPDAKSPAIGAASDTAYKSPTTNPVAGGWIAPTNVYLNDTTYSTSVGDGWNGLPPATSVPPTDPTTHAGGYWAGFGFTVSDIPAGSEINSITIELKGKSADGPVRAGRVVADLTKDGTFDAITNSSQTLNKVDSGSYDYVWTWTNGDGVRWRWDDIAGNASFGVLLRHGFTGVYDPGGGAVEYWAALVDHVRVKVNYTDAGAGYAIGIGDRRWIFETAPSSIDLPTIDSTNEYIEFEVINVAETGNVTVRTDQDPFHGTGGGTDEWFPVGSTVTSFDVVPGASVRITNAGIASGVWVNF